MLVCPIVRAGMCLCVCVCVCVIKPRRSAVINMSACASLPSPPPDLLSQKLYCRVMKQFQVAARIFNEPSRCSPSPPFSYSLSPLSLSLSLSLSLGITSFFLALKSLLIPPYSAMVLTHTHTHTQTLYRASGQSMQINIRKLDCVSFYSEYISVSQFFSINFVLY